MENPRNFLIFVAMMKKLILLAAAALLSGAAFGQTLSLKVPENVPEAAREVLVQRFTQMLQGSGITLADDGAPLTVTAQVVSRVETPGSMSQTALSIDLVAKAGEAVATFPVKGVGESDADAWLRAVKQLLPKSKSALEFVEKLK